MKIKQLEPTYLRYVYDGLDKGSISSNNPTSLPIGFIGLFEDEFPSSMPLGERMSLLNRLAMWALMKGPVSIEMVAEILNEDSDRTKALVDRYSKWFNSPEPGKYVLFHDRLRTYLLQKLSNHEVQDLNETLISYLNNGLIHEKSIEVESYALEHLSTHMAVESQLNNNYDRLHVFVNSDNLWPKQVRASKEYKWSQQAVQYGIKEGARRHHELNTLTSTVNSVKLQQEEQNNVQEILNILNEGDYQTALKRALFFSREKLMTVYLLMIHELTIGESKDVNYNLKACKSIIEFIKNSQPEKTKYPILAIYKYHIELFKMKLDDKIIWDIILTDSYGDLDTEKIKELLSFENIDLESVHRITQRATNSLQTLIPIYIDIVLQYEARYNRHGDKQHLFNGLNLLCNAVNFLFKIDIYSWSEASSLEINNQEFYDLSKAYVYIIDYMLDYTYKYNLDIPFTEAELFKLQDLLLNLHISECQEIHTTEYRKHAEIKMLSIYERFDNHKEIKKILNGLVLESHSIVRRFKESIISIAKFYIFRGDYGTYKKYLSYIEEIDQISIHLELCMLMLGLDLRLFPYLTHITPSSSTPKSSSLHHLKESNIVVDEYCTKEASNIALSIKNDLDILDATATSDEIYKRQDLWIKLYIIFSESRDFENANYAIENAFRYSNKNLQLKTKDIMKCAISYFKYGQIDKCNEFISYALDVMNSSNLNAEKQLVFKSLASSLRSIGSLDILVKLYYEDCKGNAHPLALLLRDWNIYIDNNISSFFYYLNSKIKGVKLLSNQFRDTINESSASFSIPITAFLPFLKEIEHQKSDANILIGLDQLTKLMNELLAIEYIYKNLDFFLQMVHQNDTYSPLIFDTNKNCFLVNNEFVIKPDYLQINLYLERLQNYIDQLDKNKIFLRKAGKGLKFTRSTDDFKQFRPSDQIYWSSEKLQNIDIKDSILKCLNNKDMSFEDLSNKMFFGERCLRYCLNDMIVLNEIRINSQDHYCISNDDLVDLNQEYLQPQLEKLDNSEINNLTKDKRIDYHNNIISNLDFRNDKDEILVLLNECWDIVRSIDDLKHITSQLGDMSLNFANIGEFEKAKIIVNKIDDKSFTDSFLKAESIYEISLIIIKQFDQRELAIDFLKDSFAVALNTEFYEDERFKLYSKIICKLLDLQENKLAYALSIKGATKSSERDDFKQSDKQNEFVYDDCYDAYFEIAFKFIDYNKEEDAFKIIDSIKNQQKSLEFRLSYIQRLINEENKVKALDYLNKVISSGKSLDDMNHSSSYNPINDVLYLLKPPFIISLVKIFILMKDNSVFDNNKPNYYNDKITSYLHEALISVLNCEDDMHSTGEYCLSRIAELFLQINNIDDAKLILENHIENKSIRSGLLFNVIEKLLELNKINEAFIFAKNNNLKNYSCFTKFLSFEDVLNFSKLFKNDNLVEAISKDFNLRSTNYNEEYMYLSHLNDYTSNLPDLLLYKAKMACFFETKRDEEKLNLLSQVLDIEDWRNISANL